MFKALQVYDAIEIACCFPIVDENRMLSGVKDSKQYYSFHAMMDGDDIKECYISEFKDIYNDYIPDVIHIWGTEYLHSLVAIRAAEEMGIICKVVVHIQGLVSAIAPYYNYGVDTKWLKYRCNGYGTMQEDNNLFFKMGINEKEILKSGVWILGRTNWDSAYVKYINKESNYHHCGELLREDFYKTKTRWSASKCRRHCIFISQAGYALKGLHLIIPAIARLKEEYSDIAVVVAGKNGISEENSEKELPHDRYLLDLMDRYNVNDVFMFVGSLTAEEMIKQYSNTHVFVSCSTIENSSNAIGEAQLLGVPVVASYTGGTSDIVQHEKTGLLYQMDADYMFISCIKRIFDDDSFAENLSDEEIKVARKRYDRKTVSKQLISIYEEVNGNNGKYH